MMQDPALLRIGQDQKYSCYEFEVRQSEVAGGDLGEVRKPITNPSLHFVVMAPLPIKYTYRTLAQVGPCVLVFNLRVLVIKYLCH